MQKEVHFKTPYALFILELRRRALPALDAEQLRWRARAAARRRGIPDWRPLLQRMSAAISVELQRRLVAQVRRCMPEEPEAESPQPPLSQTRVPDDEEQRARGPRPGPGAGSPALGRQV